MASYRAGVTGQDKVLKNLKALARGPTASEINRSAISSMQPMLLKTVERARTHRDYVGKWPGPWPEPDIPPAGGHVDQGIVVKRVKSQAGYVYRLGATKRARYLLHLLEFGTAPHYQPNLKYFHPGSMPNPVLLPSFDEERGEVPRAFARLLWGQMMAKLKR